MALLAGLEWISQIRREVELHASSCCAYLSVVGIQAPHVDSGLTAVLGPLIPEVAFNSTGRDFVTSAKRGSRSSSVHDLKDSSRLP